MEVHACNPSTQNVEAGGGNLRLFLVSLRLARSILSGGDEKKTKGGAHDSRGQQAYMQV